ncbi:hypothetical protein Tco_0778481 [Tanacetum coccineum]
MSSGGNTCTLDSIWEETGQDCNSTRRHLRIRLHTVETASRFLVTPSEHSRLDLLRVADTYDVSDMKDVCQDILIEDIDSENMMERLQTVFRYHLPRLKICCIDYLVKLVRSLTLKMNSMPSYNLLIKNCYNDSSTPTAHSGVAFTFGTAGNMLPVLKCHSEDPGDSSETSITVAPTSLSISVSIQLCKWDFIRVTILAFFGSLAVFLEVLYGTMLLVFLDNYGFGLDGNLGWRNYWLNEEPTHQERVVLHVLVTYFLLRSDHRLVEDHEKRPMGIFWNLYMSLMYADDVTFCNFALSKIDLPTFQFSFYMKFATVGHVSVYAEQRCLLAQCMRKVYVEIAKSPKCIIVLLTHGFLACNLICCMAFGTSKLNGFTKGVWNRFNTMSRLENLSDN